MGCEEEKWRMEIHDPSTCVEPCIHNPLIYRPTKAPTVPVVSGPARTGHTKSPHLSKPPLKDANGTAPTRPATAAPLGARSLHDPPMGSGPERGKRCVRGTMIRRDDRPRDSMTRQPAIKTGLTPSRLAWRTPKAEGVSSWMGRPAQEPSKPRPAAPRLFQNRRTARGPLTGE